MQKYLDYRLPEIPKQIPVVNLPDINLNKSADFFEWEKEN